MSNNYVIRYGSDRKIGEFSARDNDDYKRRQKVVIRSSRGVEWGDVLCPATDKSREFLGTSETTGKILRAVSTEDQLSREEARSREQDEFEGCKQLITQHKLQMDLVDVEHIFGGERIIFYYLAENRVDFRELVKDLAKKFATRIEMRQIGVRDEAKLLADYGDCGRPVCCGSYLQEMPPVSMKMAKVQKATLDPNKISGRCGRLKCCLRYEQDIYEEHKKELPKVGSTVVTKEGEGKVIGQEILAKKVVINFGDRRAMVDQSDILTVIKSNDSNPKSSDKKPKRSPKPPNKADSGNKSEPKSQDSNPNSKGESK